ncbi:Pancreatic triacylglycerol lipase [Eumeta japonica]|uniref:Pancreatic triacylglycerol lipase n=1 Tax=Eumeta variegata TaxID=151549 RepID=A0A4C1Y964_EUMVA|nr:Pancreatic triacylglycerol lipase [Eumeta japonica]
MKKVAVFVALLAACSVRSSEIEDITKDILRDKEELPRFIQFADSGDTLHTVDLEAPVDYELLEEVTRNPANNEYWLYTRRNSLIRQTLVHGNVNSVRNSNFDANKQTVVIVHGWLSNGNTDPNPTVRRAYLNKLDVNVITVDWRRLALSDYTTAALGVPAVGRGVGEFLVWLNTNFGARFDNMHLVGFSLGAHLVGNAGRAAGGRIARVTGLDPAGPLWNYNSNRLGPNDGVYVEAIHTDGGYSVGGLGIGSAIAQVDFFPNGGISQPACYTNLCNHNRAWELFGATVSYNHLEGRLCSSSLQITWNTCRGVALRMGNDDLRKTGVKEAAWLYELKRGENFGNNFLDRELERLVYSR